MPAARNHNQPKLLGFRVPQAAVWVPDSAGLLPHTEETAEFLAKHPGHAWRLGDVTLYVFETDALGDGMMITRYSADDANDGETMFTLVHKMIERAEDNTLRARYLVMTEHNSGRLFFEDRIDLRMIVGAVYDRWCRWVMFPRPDRVARDSLEALILLHFLRDTSTGFHIADLDGGRAIDLNNSENILVQQMLLAISEKVARDIVNNGKAGIRRLWMETGLGHPNRPKIGFQRPGKERLVQDMEIWPILRQVPTIYEELALSGKTGVREVADELERRGLRVNGKPLGPTQVHRILTDPIYVTGRFTDKFDGDEYDCWTEQLDDPFPAQQFDRNNRRLRATVGGAKPDTIGKLPLNRLNVVHRACAGSTDARGRTVGIRSELRRREIVHLHKPFTPECCYGRGTWSEELQQTVIRVLRATARSGEVMTEWNELALREWTSGNETAENPQVGNLRARGMEFARKEGIEPCFGLPQYGGIFEEMIRIEARNSLLPDVSDIRPKIPFYRDDFWLDIDEDRLARLFLEVVTEETPPDIDLRILREEAIAAAVDTVYIDDTPDGATVTLVGTLIHPKHAATELIGPAKLASRQLRAYEGDRDEIAGVVPQGMPYGTTPAKRLARFKSEPLPGPLRPAWLSAPVPIGASENEIEELAMAAKTARLATPAMSRPVLAESAPPVNSSSSLATVPPAQEPGPSASPRLAKTRNFAPEVLARVVELRIEECSLTRITRQLTEEGLPTPGGGRWHPATVKDAITTALELLDLSPAERDALLVVRVPRVDSSHGSRAVTPRRIADRIVRQRDAGATFQAIADSLNADGVPTPRGADEWLASTVCAIYKRRKRAA